MVIFFVLGAHPARGERPCFWMAGGAQKLRLDACVKILSSTTPLPGATANSGESIGEIDLYVCRNCREVPVSLTEFASKRTCSEMCIQGLKA